MATKRTSNPPATMDQAGRVLWSTVMHDHDLRSAGQLATLQEACKSLDAAERYAAIIAKDGAVLQTKSGARDHPLIRHELSARALCCRLLSRLGIVEAAKRRVGRPGYGGIGISYDQLEGFELK